MPKKQNAMTLKVFLLSLGCPRNANDSEVLLGLLKKKGVRLTEDAEKADILVVNTCAFIREAKEESIDAILGLVSVKKSGKKLVVMGCLPQRYSEELSRDIPEIDGIFGTADIAGVSAFIEARGEKQAKRKPGVPRFLYDHRYERDLITPAHFAYVKIQEGCMNNCSYCVIPSLRGPYRSRTLASLLREIRSLRNKSGVKEINLVGQDTTLYGIDRYGSSRAARLLEQTAAIMQDGWVRMLYGHPAHFTDDIVSVIAECPAICNYVDMPIQHISDRILKRMRRKVTRKGI
ncbi:MAG: MiaB/RimO family radical SAM methylthiotransferase, partial [Candidatus Omnitrophota bacterium]